MAMLPFCGYHVADYWSHWLSMKDHLQHAPKIYRVNWFRKNEEGKFMWPGFGQNMRVLQWIAERAAGEAAGEESLLGFSPTYDDLNWSGLDFSREAFEQLMHVDSAQLLAECEDQRAYFDRIGTQVPDAFEEQRQNTIARVEQQRA
jgi:phosphoenolpyruvate carboxykinase (GTP)